MKEKRYYSIRTSQFDVVTDYYTVGQYYLVARLPKECWQVFEVAKSNEAIAYRRNGYMWLQFHTEAVHCVNHCSTILGMQINRRFPKKETLYEQFPIDTND